MRKTLVLSALGLALVVLPAGADDAKKANELDKKVLDLVKQLSDVYRNAKSLHVEADVSSSIGDGEQKRLVKCEAVYDLEKPNLFSLKTRLDGDAQAGPDVVCDGKKLLTHAKRLKQYTEGDAPEEWSGFGRVIGGFGRAMTGMLFPNLLTDDPYETLMDGVTACSYAGKEKVDGMEAHHLKFEQPRLNWELWVAAEGKPVVLKAYSSQTLENGKADTTETYKNWKIDSAPSKETFSINPPEGSKKVKLFKQPSQDSKDKDKDSDKDKDKN
jgi:hypothetical protein